MNGLIVPNARFLAFSCHDEALAHVIDDAWEHHDDDVGIRFKRRFWDFFRDFEVTDIRVVISDPSIILVTSKCHIDEASFIEELTILCNRMDSSFEDYHHILKFFEQLYLDDESLDEGTLIVPQSYKESRDILRKLRKGGTHHCRGKGIRGCSHSDRFYRFFRFSLSDPTFRQRLGALLDTKMLALIRYIFPEYSYSFDTSGSRGDSKDSDEFLRVFNSL